MTRRSAAVFARGGLLGLALWGLLATAPTALPVHVRVRSKTAPGGPQEPPFKSTAPLEVQVFLGADDSTTGSGSGKTHDQENDDGGAVISPQMTCPSGPRAPEAPLLTTTCPDVCPRDGWCIYYPPVDRGRCRSGADRTCYINDHCAYECIPNVSQGQRAWYLTVYTDRQTVEDITTANLDLNGRPTVGVNARVVRRMDNFTLYGEKDVFVVAGNEVASSYDPTDPTDPAGAFVADGKAIDKGDIVDFAFPDTFFEGLRRVARLRLENVRFPGNHSTTTTTLPALTNLCLRNTLLDRLPFDAKMIPKVLALDVSVNSIKTIDKSSLPDDLLYLNLSMNEITAIPKGTLPKGLVALDLNWNRIASIPHGSLPTTLTVLALEANGLSEVPADVTEMNNLESLNIDHNPIKALPDNIPVGKLVSLGISNCSLREVPRILQTMTKLNYLSMSGNDFSQATDFSLLPKKLTELDISNCQLKTIPPALSSLKVLNALSAAGNPSALSDISSVPRSVAILDLSNNSLTTLPPGLRRFENITSLTLADNPLNSLKPDSLPPNLMELAITGATFTSIPSDVLPASLNALHIVDSSLNELPQDLPRLSNLVNLSIVNTNVSTFGNANHLPSLQILALQDNKIRRFESILPVTLGLGLSGNGLESFDVPNAPAMVFLDLSNNSLTSVPPCIFKMGGLQILNLTGNPIRNFLPTIDQYAKLTKYIALDVDPDFFSKDCSEPILFRGYTMCPPVIPTSNGQVGHHGTKYTGWLVVLNVVLVMVLAVSLFAVWRRRKDQIRKAEELDLKTATLEKRDSSIWHDASLLKHRIDGDLIVQQQLLGSGMYGEVWLAKYKHERVAIKRLKGDNALDRELIQQFVEEIKLVSTFTHPRVVRLIGVVWTKESDIGMVTEYMSGGDLRTYLDSHPKTIEGWDEAMLQIALEITEAIVYLHSLDPILIHRDLKSRNVLLDEALHAKLSDFGISRYKMDEETMTACVGTIRWIAPEVLAGERYDETVDIYSLGIIFSEIDTHQLPFYDAVDEDEQLLSDSAIAGLVLSGSLLSSFSKSCPSEIVSLARRCTAHKPKDRPTGLQVAYELRKLLKGAQSDTSSSVFSSNRSTATHPESDKTSGSDESHTAV